MAEAGAGAGAELPLAHYVGVPLVIEAWGRCRGRSNENADKDGEDLEKALGYPAAC